MLLLLARLLHKTHCNCTIIARSSTTTVDLYASIWPQTTRFNTRRQYSSLATAFAQQCSTCYGRDGTNIEANSCNSLFVTHWGEFLTFNFDITGVDTSCFGDELPLDTSKVTQDHSLGADLFFCFFFLSWESLFYSGMSCSASVGNYYCLSFIKQTV